MDVAKRDLQYRGMRDDRIASFVWKQDANFLLYGHVKQCPDQFQYERLRQEWDTINRPKYRQFTWSAQQQRALDIMATGTGYEDEESRVQSLRWLYIAGEPGSGKSAVILEAAVKACSTMSVLIICPTGFLAHSIKAKLPELEGVENIRVDTIHGVLKYKRPGADGKVAWSPPSALRKIDLILVDEGSQYEDREWQRLFTCIQEQPHKPFIAVVADFQQLQPIEAGGMCRACCDRMQTVVLDTVYRSSDPAHLLFLNRIRCSQPDRNTLSEYYGDRHWRQSLVQCVREGMDRAAKEGQHFTWLTTTNAGASQVCEAALDHIGLTHSELEQGYLCDPTTKSTLRIVAKAGVVLRLSRNFDKQRGFVNGALATVCESLRGNAVFTARLHGTGHMVLIHPMEEGGEVFLPCCYGYATTIRRAQGADLHHGCVYFDQPMPAGRGYGYVAASRFKTREGCFLYGKLRRTDFLPVGVAKPDEILERGYESIDSDDDEGKGLEYAFDQDEDECTAALDMSEDLGNLLIDF